MNQATTNGETTDGVPAQTAFLSVSGRKNCAGPEADIAMGRPHTEQVGVPPTAIASTIHISQFRNLRRLIW
jgi:hypothetical protein